MIDGYDYTYSTPSPFSITGLAKDRPFTIYLYGTPSNEAPGRETTFTLATANGGDSAIDMARGTSETSGTFLLGFDYVVLTGTTSATGTISGSYAAVAAHGGEGDFNGFQLNASVPEPSTCALFGFGTLVLVFLSRLVVRKA